MSGTALAPPPATVLEGRSALVTGASAGIGRAVALALAGLGARVTILARRRGRLEALSREIADAGGEALPAVGDLRREEDILGAFAAARERFGGVDILVNNAGVGREAPLASGETRHFREMLEVNVLAVAIATREAVADMRRRGASGHVVHVSSMSAHRVQADFGMYAATKHAVRALTEGLRLELRRIGSDIRVTAVSPADTRTEFMESMLGGAEAARALEPGYRKLDPEDVAAAVVYALTAPPHAEVHDILLRPVGQPD